jgi:PilZ domain
MGVSVVDCFRFSSEEAMTDVDEGRAVPRTTVAGHLPVRVRDGREVHLLDLSRDGARIEHLDLFRPGAACPLELPPPFGALTLPAQVVWCSVIGRKRRPGDESLLLSRSGLRFTKLTVAQDTALAWLLSPQHQPTA